MEHYEAAEMIKHYMARHELYSGEAMAAYMGIEALELCVPESVIENAQGKYKCYECPKCRKLLDGNHPWTMGHCPNCGKALKWEPITPKQKYMEENI